MADIIFKPLPAFQPRDEEWMVCRVAQLVEVEVIKLIPGPHGKVEAQKSYYKKENGSWVLDRMNNWFLEYNPVQNEFRLSYRNDRTAETSHKMEMLKKTLLWLLHLEECNPEKKVVSNDARRPTGQLHTL